jgi:type I restriction enzyme S subunit
MEAVGELGGLDLSASKPIGDIGSGYTYFADNDVVVAKITPCFENGKGALARGLRNGVAFGTTELHVLRAKPTELHPEYLFYLSISYPFRGAGEASMYGAGGQKRLPESFIKDLRWTLPPLSEQRAIAAFLDRATARIDLLIEKKRRLLALLQEKRSAIIAQAVSRGLDRDARVKESGIPWFGLIPAQWKTMQLKFAVRFQRGHDLPQDARSDGRVPVVSSSGISGHHNVAAARGPGVVTGRYGTIGKFSFIEGDYWPLNTTLYTNDTRGNNVRYLWWMLHVLEPLFVLNSQKSAVPGVDRNDLHPLMVAVPPLAEQGRIAEYLDASTSQLDRAGSVIERACQTLAELRSALISSAVTGRIDVREAA